MAARLGGAPATAYSHSMSMYSSVFLDPRSTEDFERMASEAIAAAARVDDPYLQYMIRLAIGFDGIMRGRLSATLGAAEEILSLGRKLDDPRSISWGMFLKAFVASLTGDFAQSLEFSEIGVKHGAHAVRHRHQRIRRGRRSCLAGSSRGPSETRRVQEPSPGRWIAVFYRGDRRPLGRRLGDAGEPWRRHRLDRGLDRAKRGRRLCTYWRISRGLCCARFICEMVSRTGKPSLRFLVRNLGLSVRAALSVESRVATLVGRVRQNPQLDPNGLTIGR